MQAWRGKIFAFRTKTLYFGSPKDRFRVGDETFAFVMVSEDDGYQAIRLICFLHPSAESATTLIWRESLKYYDEEIGGFTYCTFDIRLATPEEELVLWQAVNDGTATTTYGAITDKKIPWRSPKDPIKILF
jgi:hypothetical protein